MRTHFYSANLLVLLLSLVFAGLGHAQTYCNPTYQKTDCSNWRITKVVIPQASFNDAAFTSGGCSNERDKTSTTINMNAGFSYNIGITTTGWVACGMAIDFNQNGSFESDENIFMPVYIATNAATYNGNFTIPSSLNPGKYRMRIWNREANSGSGDPAQSACGTYLYGNWVDYTISITTALSTSETVQQSKIKIYPNPVSDVLTIEDVQTIQSVEIFDFNGKLLKNESINKKSASVRLSNLVPGTYTGKIKNSKGSQVFKFIKK